MAVPSQQLQFGSKLLPELCYRFATYPSARCTCCFVAWNTAGWHMATYP